MGHIYHEIFLHLNWHTKGDMPLLTGQVELDACQAITRRCQDMKGVYLHKVGGTDDHVHLALSIEPFVDMSKMVGQIKGGSSHDLNEGHSHKVLDWQRGYGIVSFGKKQLKWVIGYIANQRERHRNGTIQDRLEATGNEEERQDEGQAAQADG
jgi:putative transposase